MRREFKKLEFDKIIELSQKYCLTTLGKEKYQYISYLTDIQLIRIELKKTSEFKYIIENYDFPDMLVVDKTDEIKNALHPTVSLQADDFFQILNLIQKTKDIVNFLKDDELSVNFPNLKKLTQSIKFYPYVVDRIKQVIDTKGEIKKSASKRLKDICSEIILKEQQVIEIVKKVFDYAKKQNFVEANAQISVRNGRLLIPLLAQYKNKIHGVVVDRSETGKTIYIEPYKAVEVQNIIEELKFEKKKEIRKILFQLTADIREYLPHILQYYEFIAELDFIRSKALFAIEIQAEEPLITDKPFLKILKAKHPLLFMNFKQQNKSVVPLNIELNEQRYVILISGPNAGGKSVALKTVGLLQLMIQTGFLVSASLKSIFGIFENIFVDIGDDQSIENDLSTYSSHMINLKNILKQATPKSLILIDEFGTGTDPTLGSAIAQAILEQFLKLNFKAIITTHYSNLKYFAAENPKIENAAMLFDNQQLKPLYRLEIGQPGSSYTFEIAANIGLDKEIINKAKIYTGKQKINFEQLIAKIQSERQQLAEQKKQLIDIKKQLKKKVIDYRQEYEKLLKQKKEIIQQAQQQAQQILKQANRLIENTIREIKTNNAKKEITKKIRKNFEQNKEQLQQKLKTQITEIQNNLEKIPKRKKITEVNKPIKTGDFVEIENQNITGEVIQIKDNTAMLSIGGVRMFVPITKLRKTTPPKPKQPKININISVPANGMFLSIDVRGLRADEAISKVAKFIDNALISEARELRILHGTGDGVLRKVIREYLSKLDFIDYFSDADIRQGGQGVTVIKFK